MDPQAIVDRGTIFRATVGSTVHGLHHGGQDDRDEMAVFVEPPEYLLGLARARGIREGLFGFEHYIERTQPEGVRSDDVMQPRSAGPQCFKHRASHPRRSRRRFGPALVELGRACIQLAVSGLQLLRNRL